MYCECLRRVLSGPTLQVPRYYMGLGSCSRHSVSTTVFLLKRTMLRHARVIESNIGMICAFFPSLPGFYLRHRLKPSQVVALKTVTNRVTPFQVKPKMTDDCLETGILELAQGEGKCLESSDMSNRTGSTNTARQTENNT